MIRSRGAKRKVTSLFIQNCCFPRSIPGVLYNSTMLFVNINIILTIHSEFGALPNSDLIVTPGGYTSRFSDHKRWNAKFESSFPLV